MESLNQTYQVLYIDTSYFSFKILINHISKEEQIHRSYFSPLYSRMYILSYLLYFVAQFSKSATLFDFRVSIAKNRKEGKTERERERERKGTSRQSSGQVGRTEKGEWVCSYGSRWWSGVSIVNQYPDGCRRFERAPYFSMPIHWNYPPSLLDSGI